MQARPSVNQGRPPATRARPRLALYWLASAAPFLFLGAFALGPLVQQAIGSFFNWYDLRPSTFAGWKNYVAVLDDAVARSALLHTVVYVAISVPLEVALGLWTAWVTMRVHRGRAGLCALFVLPLVIPWSAVSTLFLGFFDTGGVLDSLRSDLFGAHQAVLWFQDPRLAFAVVVLMGVWKGRPWCFLLIFSALSRSPVDPFEAARIDGARGLRYCANIVVPAIWPMLVFVTVFRTFGEAQMYTSVALLSGSGALPLNVAQLASTYDNTLAFQYFEFGQASALATMTGAALLGVAAIGFASMFGPARHDRHNAVPGASPPTSRPGRPTEGLVAADGGTLIAEALEAAPRRPPLPSRQLRGRPASAEVLPRWRSMSTDRRKNAFLAGVTVVVSLVPLLGGLPGGALRLDFSLHWRLITTGLGNSAVLTVATVLGTLVLAVPAAYVLAHRSSRWRSGLFGGVLLAMAVPGALVLLPQYQEMSWLGLVNTRLALVILYVAADLPIAVFFLRAAFASVPQGLVENIAVDGASHLQAITRLFVPLSADTIITVTVLIVVQVWNEVPLAVTLLNSRALLPLPVLGALGVGGMGSLGASWVIMAPPLLLFLLCQRRFQNGLLAGRLL